MTLHPSALPGWSGPGSVGEDAVYEAFVAWAEAGGFALYPAQDESAIEVVGGANLILSTPTGTGKSLVAVAAHFAALARGERSFYTAPIQGAGLGEVLRARRHLRR